MAKGLPIIGDYEIISAQNIRDAEDQLRSCGEAYLRARGWDQSSSHPGSYWMFSKKIGRKTYHLHYKDAVEFQRIQEARS